jgi:hypothetical protein
MSSLKKTIHLFNFFNSKRRSDLLPGGAGNQLPAVPGLTQKRVTFFGNQTQKPHWECCDYYRKTWRLCCRKVGGAGRIYIIKTYLKRKTKKLKKRFPKVFRFSVFGHLFLSIFQNPKYFLGKIFNFF